MEIIISIVSIIMITIAIFIVIVIITYVVSRYVIFRTEFERDGNSQTAVFRMRRNPQGYMGN